MTSRSCAEEISNPPVADIRTTATYSPAWRVNEVPVSSNSVNPVSTSIPACAAPAQRRLKSNELSEPSKPYPNTPCEPLIQYCAQSAAMQPITPTRIATDVRVLSSAL